METMNTVTLNICGTDYVVTTDESVGYMQELAAQLDTRIRNKQERYTATSLRALDILESLKPQLEEDIR